VKGRQPYARRVDGLLIGYARVSTDGQGLASQRAALAAMGVAAERVYNDQGLTGRTGPPRPGGVMRRDSTFVVASGPSPG